MCGDVPLGVLIGLSTNEEAYTAGFQYMMDSFGDSAFGGESFSSVFIIDDGDAERNALKAMWSAINLKPCLFHVAQALSTWLVDAERHIDQTDRKERMLQFAVLCIIRVKKKL